MSKRIVKISDLPEMLQSEELVKVQGGMVPNPGGENGKDAICEAQGSGIICAVENSGVKCSTEQAAIWVRG